MINSKKSDSIQLKGKLKILKKQKKRFLEEIEQFIKEACNNGKILKDEKLKLYNKPGTMNRIGKITSLAKGMETLMKKNLELWQLEDEARKVDVPLSYIGKIKRKIDIANQQRNDLIDKIDELLEKSIREKK